MFDLASINISPIKAIVPAIANVLAIGKSIGMPIVYLKMQYGPDLAKLGGVTAPNFIKHKKLRVGDVVAAPDGTTGRILVRDTWNTAIVDALTPLPGDIVIEKHRFSGFFETELDHVLRSLNVDTLVVTGATTSVCVDSTVRDAMFRDYRCLVLADCVAEPLAAASARSNHEASLLTFEVLLGWVAESSAFVSALSVRQEAAE
jgi:ureidoacrylate peracid hydrolase